MNGSSEKIFNTIVIGGGQAGLAVAYYLKQQNLDFVILDAEMRVGDSWRKRWDSLELFTSAKYCSLPGLPFPAPEGHYPSKDEMGDYLEAYVQHFELPVNSNSRVQKMERQNDVYLVYTQTQSFKAQNVVVATGAFASPKIPSWASGLQASIQQMHSSAYKNPQQLDADKVLVVGAGSSGTQIALDIVDTGRAVWLAGNFTGYVPRFFLGIDVFGFLTRTIFNFSVDTFLGRKITTKMKTHGALVVDIREKDVIEAGVKRVARMGGVQDGLPVTEDDQVLDVDAIVWATGYRQNFEWIDLPLDLDEYGVPHHYRGVVEGEAGLYFMGLLGLYRGKSPLICGVGEDGQYIAQHIAQRSAQSATVKEIHSIQQREQQTA